VKSSTRPNRRRRDSARDRAIKAWIAEKRKHAALDDELRSILRDEKDAA